MVVLARLAEGGVQFADPFGQIAVIVTDQNLHGSRGGRQGAQYTRSGRPFRDELGLTNLDEQDRQLFRQAMRGVRRLHADPPRPGSARPRSRPRARFSRAERAAVLQESLGAGPSALDPVAEAGDALLFRRVRPQRNPVPATAPRPIPGRWRNRPAWPDGGHGGTRSCAHSLPMPCSTVRGWCA